MKLSYKHLLLISLPSLAAVGMEPLAELIDTIILGKKKSIWIASLAATNAFLSSFAWIFGFLSSGVTSQVAKKLGAQKFDALSSKIKLAIYYSIFFGLLVSCFLFFGRVFFLKSILGADSILLTSSTQYWNIRVLTYPLVLLSITLIGIFRGLQHFSFTLSLVLLSTIINSFGTYYAVHVEDYGIKGAAFATVLSFLAVTVIALVKLFRLRREYNLNYRVIVKIEDFLNFGKKSLDLFLRSFFLSGSLFIMMAMTTRLGNSVLSSHQIIVQLWLFCAFFIDGFAVTANSLGAHFLGQNKTKKLLEMSYKFIFISFIAGCLLLCFFYFFKTDIFFLFTKDDIIHQRLESLWLLVVFMQPLNSILYVLDGIMLGMQKFRYIRLRMVEGFFIFFLPLSFLGYLYYKNLFFIWCAFSSLCLYRFFSSSLFMIKFYLRNKQD